jgi:pimeloyl-ACP methyl ester carboxylesterase
MLVVLLGWGASTPAHLESFVRAYAGLGFHSHVFICDGFRSLVRYDQVAAACEAQARAIAALAGDDEIIVHAFSDNGFIGFCQLLRAWRGDSQAKRILARIRGVVLDSSPGLHRVSPAEFSRRFACALTQVVSHRLGVRRSHVPLLTPILIRCFDLYQRGWAATVQRLRGAYDEVEADYPACPHLFVYGADDPIVPRGDVEGFAAKLRERGVAVHLHRFDTAVHVGSFWLAPQVYWDEVRRLCSLAGAPTIGISEST